MLKMGVHTKKHSDRKLGLVFRDWRVEPYRGDTD